MRDVMRYVSDLELQNTLARTKTGCKRFFSPACYVSSETREIALPRAFAQPSALWDAGNEYITEYTKDDVVL
jgi:hypothetical protein